MDAGTVTTCAPLDSTSLPTPTGPLSLVVDDAGTLVAAGFCAVADLERRLRATTRHRCELGAPGRAVASYGIGDLAALDDLAVDQAGTAHQQAVWKALRDVPAGQTVSYGELCARLGLPPGTARAVGSACGANLIAPVVPCHRVVRGDGSLGGYAYGLSVKRFLLDHERGRPGPDGS